MKTPNLTNPLFFAVLMTVIPFTNANATDGVIHFQGAIVEGGCKMLQQEKTVTFSCAQKGKPVVHSVALSQLNNYTTHTGIPLATKLQYLDEQHHLAILQVTYQ